VGIDINPVRIKDTRANAKKAGVADKVEARTGDVLKIADLSDATVVMLYLNEHLNERLRPILQKMLKPGARIVSHEFNMGDWRPHQTRKVRGEDNEEYDIYLWRIEKKK
jgi:predicted O-methyltransferase YrrM